MKTLTRLATATIVSVAYSAVAADMPRVEGEIAKPSAIAAKIASRLPLLGSIEMQANPVSIELPIMDTTKIDAIRKSNSVEGVKKWVQIGLTRAISDELQANLVTGDLRWKRTATGNMVAYLRVQSKDAKAIRVGLNVSNVPEGLELRFIGSDQPTNVVALANAGELMTLKDAHGIYWTPITDGEYQVIELSLPASAKPAELKFAVDSVSHIFATPTQKFADAKVSMATQSCIVDVVCVAQTPGFVNAKNAVAQLIFQVRGNNG